MDKNVALHNLHHYTGSVGPVLRVSLVDLLLGCSYCFRVGLLLRGGLSFFLGFQFFFLWSNHLLSLSFSDLGCWGGCQWFSISMVKSGKISYYHCEKFINSCTRKRRLSGQWTITDSTMVLEISIARLTMGNWRLSGKTPGNQQNWYNKPAPRRNRAK